MNRYYPPEGTQDYLPLECFNKRSIENKLRQMFLKHSYSEIEGAGLEPADLVLRGPSSLGQEQLYFIPQLGEQLLTLRPDGTLPMARIASTYFQDAPLPLRLCYLTTIYRYQPVRPGEQREQPQAGVELLGLSGPEADAEIIALMIESLLSLGIGDFQIEIGQVEFFKQILSLCSFDLDTEKRLQQLIEQKNTIAIEQFLSQFSIDANLKELILKLPNLYGPYSILEEAKKLTPHPRCAEAITNLEAIYDILSDYGFGQYLSFDLGLVHNVNYYTGAVFRILSKQLGSSLCSGGRYDQLLSHFGESIPATGAAIELKKVLLILEKEQKLQDLPPVDTLILCTPEQRKEAYMLAQKLRDKGEVVEIRYQSTPPTSQQRKVKQTIHLTAINND